MGLSALKHRSMDSRRLLTNCAGTMSRATDLEDRTETEKALADIWAYHLPRHTAETLPRDAKFDDLGGHSIAAVQILSKINRHWNGANVPMGEMTSKQPTLRKLARYIDRSLNPVDLRMDVEKAAGEEDEEEEQTEQYSNDLANQIDGLPTIDNSAAIDWSTSDAYQFGIRILLTGATGFLGAYILHDAVMRTRPNHVYAHVRAASHKEGMERLRTTCTAYGLWHEWWATEGVVEVIIGDLEKPRLGLNESDYDKVAKDADMVIHNGARVHWLLPYEKLKPANVQSTLECIKLCASEERPKRLAFVSSTSALDTEYYISRSDDGSPVLESDDLEGSRQGLGTGYGQTKWVSEKLIMEACKRGLHGVIIRPGYVMGDEKSGVTNTDDFLVRMLKGCLQIGSRPNMKKNTINMVPVPHVARKVLAVALQGERGTVSHIDARPRLTFNAFLKTLEEFGYPCPQENYSTWKVKVEQFVESGHKIPEQLALLGLYHMVTGDLPGATEAPDLDDTNAAAALLKDEEMGEKCESPSGVTKEAIGAYLSFLVARGFMPQPPTSSQTTLPVRTIPSRQAEALNRVGGRGGVSS